MPVPGYADRNEEFAMGHSPSLDQQQTMMAQQQPRRFRASAANQQVQLSNNGMSEETAKRVLLGGARLPSQNGIADSSYQQKMPLLNATPPQE